MGRDMQKQQKRTRSGGWVVVKRDNGRDEIGLENRSGGPRGTRSIVSRGKCNRRYMPYSSLARCVGVGTGGAGGTRRRKYRGSMWDRALRKGQNKAIGGSRRYKENSRRSEDTDIEPCVRQRHWISTDNSVLLATDAKGRQQSHQRSSVRRVSCVGCALAGEKRKM
jgi:hypothetical protein